MTSIRTDAESAAADRAQTFLDWTKINAKALTAGAIIVLVAAAGYWFYLRQQEIKSANAEKSLLNAKQSLSSGNMPLAQSDLQKVWAQYGSTSAGVEAAMLLAQMDYDGGKYQDGVSLLEKAAGSGGADRNESAVLSLEGDGYMQMNKAADAAKAYQAAAAAAPGDIERSYEQAKAARAFATSGDTASARKLWQSLADDPKAATVAAEAKVRLGELSAAPAKK
ncbi:MAG TPA: tetratricopeptide repeat protein [Gemmatimonadaceae bacterium]|nr:tetratricopeptide repeat protein [Gemmatimonadaceae bacterium]